MLYTVTETVSYPHPLARSGEDSHASKCGQYRADELQRHIASFREVGYPAPTVHTEEDGEMTYTFRAGLLTVHILCVPCEAN